MNIWEAAENIPPMLPWLLEQPNKGEWIEMAMSIKHGRSQGERLLKLNPEYYRQSQALYEEEESVRQSVMKK